MDVGIESGEDFYETPRIDALARKGMRFAQVYATCQVCSPSRAGIMLGTYSARHGITQWIGSPVGAEQAQAKLGAVMPPDYVRELPADDTTIAEAFREAGYETFFAGKWHLGGEGSWPEDHGFDINRGGWDVGGPRGGLKVRALGIRYRERRSARKQRIAVKKVIPNRGGQPVLHLRASWR